MPLLALVVHLQVQTIVQQTELELHLSKSPDDDES